uniref:MFS domain-containing protein n=1 Tax=Panagrellus redivivus TaxID=6233 RepID=A0A7E4VDF0_PANRE
MTRYTSKYALVAPQDEGTDWRSIMISNIVAFLGSVQMSSITPTVWPYMKKIDVTTTETLYGFIRGLYAVGNVVFSMLSGYASNKIADTRPAMLIGKTICIFGALAYLFIEVFHPIHVLLFIAFEFLLGTSSGVCSVYRTHIAMASTEADRPKAFGITQLATAAGFVVGPLLQVIFAQIGFPGWPLFLGTHFNVYTAPVVLSAVTSIVGLILLVFYFDGRMRIRDTPKALLHPEEGSSLGGVIDEDIFIQPSPQASISGSQKELPSIDWIAVVVLILVKIASEVVVLNLITICPPYAMTAYQWTSEDTVVIQSAIMGSIGVLCIVLALGYIFLKLGKRIAERSALVAALLLFLAFHLITYPWGFWPSRIDYQHVKGTTPPSGLAAARDPALQAIIAESLLPNSTIEIVGCNSNFEWCEVTPKVNIYLFNAALIIALGVGWPLIQINLDVLYSKVLGPIKQGTLQGVFVAVGQVLNIAGPLFFSKLYTLYGPRVLWAIVIAICLIALTVFVVFFKRVIPWSQRKDVQAAESGSAHLKTLPMPTATAPKRTQVGNVSTSLHR